MAHEIFISHSSQDKPIADGVCAGLEASGLRCWIAPRDVQPGLSFAGEIKRAIQRSKIMVLIFSAHSNASEQVLREVQLAANAHLHIVQFRIENVIPNDDLDYYLSTPHWLDAVSPPVEAHIQHLATSLKALLQLGGPLPETVASDIPSSAGQAPPVTAKPATQPRQAFAAAPAPLAAPAESAPIEMSPAHKRRLSRSALVSIGVLALALIAAVFVLIPKRPGGTGTVSIANSRQRDIATSSSSSVPGAAPANFDLGRNPAFTFVDMNRVFKNYSKTKNAETKINEQKNAAKKEYDERADAYKAKLNSISQMSAGSSRDRAISEIKAMEKEINNWRTAREKELQDQASKLREGIVKEITAEIGKLNPPDDNLVFDSSGQSLNGVPFFILKPDPADMSDRVISGLNNSGREMFVTTRSLRLALVDMNDTFNRYFKTKEAETKINDAKNEAKREYDDRADAYKTKLTAMNAMASGASRDHAITELKAMEKEINDFRTTREKQLQSQALRLRGDIIKEIESLIEKTSGGDARVIVLDVSGQSLNGRWAVFFHGIPDLTNDIVEALNRQDLTGSPKVSFASTENLRFGQLSMDRAIKASPEGMAAETEINNAKDQAKAELGDHPDATAKAAKDKELESLAKAKRNAVTDRIAAHVATEAQNAGLNLVFDSSGQSSNNLPVAIAIRDIPDITDKVIADLQQSTTK